MKKIFIISLLILSACSQKPFSSKELADIPAWVSEEEDLGAVGIASPSKGGLKFQIAIAELDAKGNLAAKIKSDITRVTKNSLRSANVNNADDVEEFFAQATKEVVNDLPLMGVARDKIHQAKDGSLYVHVSIKSSAYDSYLGEVEKAIKDKARKDLARENINETEKATKAIFEELERERKGIDKAN